jgi:hypothetical protein
VVGWQIMALKSAQMAGLLSGSGGYGTFDGASKWLDSVQSGDYNSLYAYQPARGATPTMTSVGLLCRQYLGAKRDSQMIAEGVRYLMTHAPDVDKDNCYYWYYATQVLHNMTGPEWDTWNRKMRRVLVDSQCKDPNSCSNGSWNPENDHWGPQGGRVMITALSCLTLEIYYRYLPLFKMDAEGGAHGAPKDAKPGKAKDEPPKLEADAA